MLYKILFILYQWPVTPITDPLMYKHRQCLKDDVYNYDYVIILFELIYLYKIKLIWDILKNEK